MASARAAERRAHFQAPLVSENERGTSTYIRVPDAAMEAFAPKRRVPVVASLNGFEFRTTIANLGGGNFIAVRAEIRHAAKLRAGDIVKVVLTLDAAERIVEIPKDLMDAMNDGERATFERMSYTQRKECVRAIEGAKKAETRARRVAAAIRSIRAKTSELR